MFCTTTATARPFVVCGGNRRKVRNRVAEYALLDDRGEIVNVVTTTDDLPTVQEKMKRVLGDVVVKPLSQIPLGVKERYQYWSERP